MLFTLDHRALDAQIRQTQGILNGAQGAARAGHARRRALRSAGRQERHHPGHAQQRQDPGQHLHRRGRIEHRAARAVARAARLHVHSRADHRPRQHGEREGRQLRAAGRSDPARHHHPGRSGLRHLRAAAAQSAGTAAGDHQRDRDDPGDRSRRRPAGDRPGDHGREHGRSPRPARCRCARPCPIPTSCCGRERWCRCGWSSARRRRSWCPQPAIQVARPGRSSSS